MSEAKDPVASEATEKRQYETGSSHKGLVFGAAILVSAGTILAAAYGIRSGSLVLKALALEGALATLAAWLSLHAYGIRRRLIEAHEWQPQGSQDWDELEEEGVNVTLQDVYHARTIHLAVLAAPITLLVGFLAIFLLWTQSGGEAGLLPAADTAAASVICLVACCLWLVLSRSFEAFGREEVPEGPALMLAFRDLQWTTLLVAVGILGTLIWPEDGFWGNGEPWSPPEIWVARLMLVWTLAVCLEQLIRIILAWFGRDWVDDGFVSPTHLLLREAVFVRGNPIASLFETIEARFGVSFRSSWAIRFVRAAAVPSLIAVLLLFWGLTCLSIVGTDEFGIRESFGRIRGELPGNLGQASDDPLPPGLHLKLPWPFGRIRHYPVKKVFTLPIGFVPTPGQQRAFLWTKEHAEEEFGLVLGSETQIVAVNALVYYKIREDKQGFLDYVYQFADTPDDGAEGDSGRAMVETALDAFAHRALMEATRSATLEEVLSTNRAEFANGLKESLREYSAANRLGIDVIDVALVLMHPPTEAAKDYLDVISAEVDADRMEIEAQGERLVTLQQAETESYSMVANKKAYEAKRVGEAYQESAKFSPLSQAYAVAPEAFKQRLQFETYEEALSGRTLIVTDEDVYVDTRTKNEPITLIPGGVP